jgi:hypothetical protein
MRMLRDQRFSRFRVPAVIGLVLVFGFLYFQILHRRVHERPSNLGDFYHFYAATVAMSQGQDIYRSGTGGYVYPPLLAFLYLPLAHLQDRTAAAVALTINVPLMILALLVGARDAQNRMINHDDREPISLGLLALAAFLTSVITFGRLRAELTILQTDVFVLAMYIFALHWLDRRPMLAGIALGFAMNIKYYTLPGLLYLLLRRRWRAAAGFGIGAVSFALLPAMKVGLHTDLQYMLIASGGVLKSIGIQTGQVEAAHVHHIEESLSVSITSGIARLLGGPHPKAVMPLTGLIALLFVAMVAIWYRARNLRFFAWPAEIAQRVWPYRQLVMLEWAGIMIASVAFSPDSNLRHMVLVLFANAIGVTLLLAGRDRGGKLALVIGFLLQIYVLDAFGNLHSAAAKAWFFKAGGQGWGLLIFYGMLLWAGIREVNLVRPPAEAYPANKDDQLTYN